MKLFNSLVSWVFKRRIGQVQHFIDHPIEVQQQHFNDLINKAKHTAFGKEHGFASITSLETYQNQVPTRTYEQLFPYIEKIIQGEQNVLWPSDIQWFAKSSGTTSGKSKFIPVSYETLDQGHFKGGKDAMTLYCHNNPQSKVFAGKSLIMGGSHQINEFNTHSKYGDVSAVVLENMPLLGHFLRTPDLKTALLDEWEEKLSKMVSITMNQDVTNIAGVPTWTLVLIKQILEHSGKADISEIWPNLEVYFHGGVNFSPYQSQFDAVIKNPTMNYYQMYNASEGFFAMQDRNHASDMLLLLDYGIFYEFIPKEEIGKEYPKAIPLQEVKAGELYAMVISTNSGLWRYQIGDTIEFTSTSPYRIQVKGRTKSFINAFGEELIVENADFAIQKACEETHSTCKEYTAAPFYLSNQEKGCHEWCIEFETKPNSIEQFTQILDKTLQEINTDYEAKRHKDIALVAPKIHVMPDGTFTQWLREKGKLGGQNKVPRLCNNRELLEELLEFLYV